MKHRLQYLNLPLPTHLDEAERGPERSQARLWWLIVGIALLSVFLMGMALWWVL